MSHGDGVARVKHRPLLDSCGHIVKSHAREEEATEAHGEMGKAHRKRCEENLVAHIRAHTGRATERRKKA